MEKTPSSSRVDSSTYVRQKSQSPEREDQEQEAEGGDQEDETESLDMEMGYSQLMSYFESLKESSA